MQPAPDDAGYEYAAVPAPDAGAPLGSAPASVPPLPPPRPPAPPRSGRRPGAGPRGRGLLLPPLSLDAAVLRRALAAEPDPALWVAAQAAQKVTAAKHARERRLASLQMALTRHWLGAVLLVLGIWVALPWLAPVCARLGWWDAANAIYIAYLFFCHQLPERAGYLFGYQVAWCYRNTALYTSLFLAGLLFACVRQAGWSWRWLRRSISWQLLVLLSLPMLVDGLSHLMGARADNAWLDALTGGRLGAFSIGGPGLAKSGHERAAAPTGIALQRARPYGGLGCGLPVR